MGQLIYKFVAANSTNGSEPFVDYLSNSMLLFSSAHYLNDCFECRCRPRLQHDGSDNGSLLTEEILGCQKTEHLKEDNFLFSASLAYGSSSMWARYADNHKGVCLVFDTGNIFFRGGLADQVSISPLTPVRYRSYPPTEEDAHSMFFTKAIEWTFEEEVRMVFSYLNPYSKPEDGHSPCRWKRLNDHLEQKKCQESHSSFNSRKLLRGILVESPADALAEVIVGFEADPVLKDYLIDQSEKKKFKLSYAMPSHYSYRIEKVGRDPRR